MNNICIETADWQTDQQALIGIRTRVFVEEQQIPAELEIDSLDAECLHVKAVNACGDIVGTARLLPSHYIGRMCVLKEYRDQGIGGSMLAYLLDYASCNGFQSVKLHAQISALPFYQRYGFIPDSEIFMEAGIKHQHMTLSLAK